MDTEPLNAASYLDGCGNVLYYQTPPYGTKHAGTKKSRNSHETHLNES